MDEVRERLLKAARRMKADGWWYVTALLPPRSRYTPTHPHASFRHPALATHINRVCSPHNLA